LFQSPWIGGEVRKCEEETGEELGVCISPKKSFKCDVLISNVSKFCTDEVVDDDFEKND
jgi:hypothetical protein